ADHVGCGRARGVVYRGAARPRVPAHRLAAARDALRRVPRRGKAKRRYVADMKIQPTRSLAALVLAAPALVPAHAADSGERARIASERAEVEKRYADRERECRERFVVTSCVDDAKRERRKSLDALRAQELQLDEQTRRARTEARRAELAAKAAED